MEKYWVEVGGKKVIWWLRCKRELRTAHSTAGCGGTQRKWCEIADGEVCKIEKEVKVGVETRGLFRKRQKRPFCTEVPGRRGHGGWDMKETMLSGSFQGFVIAHVGQNPPALSNLWLLSTVRLVFAKHENKLKGKSVFTLVLLLLLFFLLYVWKNKRLFTRITMEWESSFACKTWSKKISLTLTFLQLKMICHWCLLQPCNVSLQQVVPWVGEKM